MNTGIYLTTGLCTLFKDHTSKGKCVSCISACAARKVSEKVKRFVLVYRLDDEGGVWGGEVFEVIIIFQAIFRLFTIVQKVLKKSGKVFPTT
jgi:hypothetical protein